MANPFQGPEFKILFQEWNEKLKNSGFEDAEDFSLQHAPLKCWHNFRFKRVSADELHQSEQYTKRALVIYWTHEFESNTHQRIWELHAEGKSIRQITEIINEPGFSRNQVHLFIRLVKRENGL